MSRIREGVSGCVAMSNSVDTSAREASLRGATAHRKILSTLNVVFNRSLYFGRLIRTLDSWREK